MEGLRPSRNGDLGVRSSGSGMDGSEDNFSRGSDAWPQLVVLRTTIAMLREAMFCWCSRFLSVVTNT